MPTRTINATIVSNDNADLLPGEYATFSVTSDTGPVSNAKATGGSLWLSRVKVYSSAFYLAVSYGGNTLATTETCQANSGDAQAEEYSLDSVDDDLLTGSPSSIVLTVTKISGDKSKINFRTGSTLTLTISYEEDTGGDEGGGDEGGGGSEDDNACYYWGSNAYARLSATTSHGQGVTLSFGGIERDPTKQPHFLYCYLDRAESSDGVTWSGWETSIDECTLDDDSGSGFTGSGFFTVNPPSTIGNYYKYRLRLYSLLYYDEGNFDCTDTLRCAEPAYWESDAYAKLSAPTSYRKGVTLSFDGAAGNDGWILVCRIDRAESTDGKTWGAWEKKIARIDETGSSGSVTVLPPPTLGHYYKYRLALGAYIYDASGAQQYWEGSAILECQTTLKSVKPTLKAYTDSTLVAGSTKIKAVHMTELQSNINTLRSAAGLATYQFTSIVSGKTSLAGWSSHVAELRDAIDGLESNHETWISFDVNKPRADVITQLRRVVGVI